MGTPHPPLAEGSDSPQLFNHPPQSIEDYSVLHDLAEPVQLVRYTDGHVMHSGAGIIPPSEPHRAAVMNIRIARHLGISTWRHYNAEDMGVDPVLLL